MPYMWAWQPGKSFVYLCGTFLPSQTEELHFHCIWSVTHILVLPHMTFCLVTFCLVWILVKSQTDRIRCIKIYTDLKNRRIFFWGLSQEWSRELEKFWNQTKVWRFCPLEFSVLRGESLRFFFFFGGGDAIDESHHVPLQHMPVLIITLFKYYVETIQAAVECQLSESGTFCFCY